jgi:hypothetical protein
MPSVVHPSSSDFPAFPVFAPVRHRLLRKARGVGAVSATPLPPSGRLSALCATPLPLGQDGSTPGSEWGENPCATVFRPFFTVFDRFSGGSESRFARRIRRSTVFAGRAVVKNGETGDVPQDEASWFILWGLCSRCANRDQPWPRQKP